MAAYRVTCINKQPRNNPHEGITHLGGTVESSKWYDTRANVIYSIDYLGNTFYTYEGGKTAHVQVVREAGKDPYLRTVADGYYTNNLLDLNECPL